MIPFDRHLFLLNFIFMRIPLIKLVVTINKVLTIINGFIFGLLIQFSPLHNKKGKARKIPLIANSALLAVLVGVLIAAIR